MKKRKSTTWSPFKRAFIPDDVWERTLSECNTEEELKVALSLYDDMIFKNNLYQVNVRLHMSHDHDGPDIVHLSIKSIDKAPIRDWRHMQRIKNEIVGPEIEMVELFPAESRLVDTANQYHMWGYMDPRYRFPFGFDEGRVVETTASFSGARQRPFENQPEDNVEHEQANRGS